MIGLRHSPGRRTFTSSALSAIAALAVTRWPSAQEAALVGRSVSPQVEKANLAVVNDFCAAFKQKDLAKAVSLLADNCTYRPTQARPPVIGKAQVEATIKVFLERGADFIVIKSVTLGPLVVNERNDVIVMESGPPRTFHIAAGLFFIVQGKIAEWTDYVLR